jgi:hypothetical protein
MQKLAMGGFNHKWTRIFSHERTKNTKVLNTGLCRGYDAAGARTLPASIHIVRTK